jgi:phage host-nuclease inhibitor protein Gam
MEAIMARKTRHTPVLSVPADVNEANDSLFRIGALDRSISAIESEYAEAVASLRAEADREAKALLTEREDRITGLNLYATTYRTKLLSGDRKSVKLTGGTFGWRMTPPKVALAKGGEEKALLKIKALGLTQYVRVKESVDREALLKDRPVIPGVSYTQREEFFVEASVDTDPEAAATAAAIDSAA